MDAPASPTDFVDKALQTWREKLAYLLEQEAITADPAQKYALSKLIQEARERLHELGLLAAPQETPLAAPPRVETRGYQWPSLQDGGVAYRIESDATGSCVETEPSVPPGTAISSPGFQPGVGSAGPMLSGPMPPGLVPPGPVPSRPPLHNLPYPPLGDLFTGRQADLDALANGETAAITQSAAISGLGGLGKTRLAVEYAWRSGPRYTAVWFVRADSPENLRRNLAALAGPELLNLPERKAQDEEETVAAVKRWLREHPGWLMILDNVDTPEAAAAVLEALPTLLEGRVLITSRLTSWPASVRRRSLDTLSREEAVRFLLHRTEEGRTKAAEKRLGPDHPDTQLGRENLKILLTEMGQDAEGSEGGSAPGE